MRRCWLSSFLILNTQFRLGASLHRVSGFRINVQPASSRCTPFAATTSIDDVPTVARLPVMPLPDLTEEELQRLRDGVRVSRQQPPERGGIGSGFSVQDVSLKPDEVFALVSDFEGYERRIKTVRKVTPYCSDDPSAQGAPCYNFLVSRIRLVLNVRFDIDPASR